MLVSFHFWCTTGKGCLIRFSAWSSASGWQPMWALWYVLHCPREGCLCISRRRHVEGRGEFLTCPFQFIWEHGARTWDCYAGDEFSLMISSVLVRDALRNFSGTWTRQDLEPTVHGRGRNPESMDDLFFGVHDEMLYARKSEPISGILVFLSLLSFTH